MITSTFASRVKEARRESNLSQAELARAIAHITKSPITKSLISQWENGKVKNPQIATMSALEAVTGFSQSYLATGRGPRKASMGQALADSQRAQPLDRTALARAIQFALDARAVSHERTTAVCLALYDILCESPDTPAAALTRVAGLLKA